MKVMPLLIAPLPPATTKVSTHINTCHQGPTQVHLRIMSSPHGVSVGFATLPYIWGNWGFTLLKIVQGHTRLQSRRGESLSPQVALFSLPEGARPAY